MMAGLESAIPDNRTVAIMQPYLFPYLGYYQLFHVSSLFVSLDNVNFIKQGWVNRNRILVQGQPHTFTVPLSTPSSFVAIRDTTISNDQRWRKKLLNTIRQAYAKATSFQAVYPLVEEVLTSEHEHIAEMAVHSLRSVLHYLGLEREILHAGSLDLEAGLTGQHRIIHMCNALGATTYINAIGGQALYSNQAFHEAGIELRFLRMSSVEYDQGGLLPFQPAMSMIDVLMWNSKEQVMDLLKAYTLET